MLKNVYEGLNARPKVYLSKEYFCKMYPTCVSSKLWEFIFLLIFIQLKTILYILYCHKFSKLSKLLKIVKVVKIVKIIKNCKIMSGQLKMINPASRIKTKISPKEPLSVSCNVVQQM